MVCDVCSADSELLMNQPKYLVFLMELEPGSSGFKSWLHPLPVTLRGESLNLQASDSPPGTWNVEQ